MKICIYTNGHNIHTLLDGIDYTIRVVDVSRFSNNIGTYYEIDIDDINSATLFTLKYSNNAVAMHDKFTVYRFT
jgi:hypothetical protein